MRRVPRIRLYLRTPPFLRALFCTVYSVWCGLGLVFAQVRGVFGAFSLYLVLIYAALFVLVGVSVLIHECVAQKRMSCWDRIRISLLNSLGMPGVNGVLWVPVRMM